MTGATDASGKSLAGDFDAQVRQVFANRAATLEEAGGKLSDMVTMTVFITDPRNHPRMTAIRREIFGKDFPASASIAHLASGEPECAARNPGRRGHSRLSVRLRTSPCRRP